ncbi:hypothetical protein SV7mr_23320 [Stieleria bergensis]|uniref:Uncharacterized protein n=1 Tax=Stieleria bergensis TaxID=2528025 RepID=A0A517SUM2_9BACT|nr:hypothetical protein SV7mr_23320 [Planctomycetes bacterium SV_7m_r]
MAQSSSSQSLPKRAPEPGGLLDDLERRQDDVLNLLDDLDGKLQSVLDALAPPTDDESDSDSELSLDPNHAFSAFASSDRASSELDPSDPEDRAIAELASTVESLQDEVSPLEEDFADDDSADDWA